MTWSVSDLPQRMPVGHNPDGTHPFLTCAQPTGVAATDNANIQALLNAGGVGSLQKGTYSVTGLTLVSGGCLLIPSGTTIKYAGAAGGSVFTNPHGAADVPLIDASVLGLGQGTIDLNSLATKVFDLHTPQACRIANLKLIGSGNGSFPIGIQFTGDITNNSAEYGTTVACYNVVSNIVMQATLYAGVVLSGGSSTTNVTDNEFHSFFMSNITGEAVGFADWADSNIFTGNHRYSLVANNAIGINFNSSNSSNNGVYNNNFESVAVDTFAGFTGRTAVLFNTGVRVCKIEKLYQDPAAESGIVVDNLSTSYWVQIMSATSGASVASKGVGWA